MFGLNATSTTNGALDQLLRLGDQYPDEVAEGVYDVVVDEGIRLIDNKLVQRPARFSGPRQWQSPEQRAAYFASGGFGKGIPYVRTGDMNDAWELGFKVERGTITVTLYNKSGHFRFVVGGLRLSDPPTQQQMHIQGGWKPVAPIIAAEIPSFQATVIRRIHLVPRDFR